MHCSDNTSGGISQAMEHDAISASGPAPVRGRRSVPASPLVTLLLLGVLAASAVHSASSPPVAGEEQIDAEPEITIIQRDDAVIKEYRIGGQLYMIKIEPAKGIPYFLVDSDGDGRLDARRSEFGEDIMIPSWTLFRW